MEEVLKDLLKRLRHNQFQKGLIIGIKTRLKEFKFFVLLALFRTAKEG